MSESRAGGAWAWKGLGVLWLGMLAGGLFFWVMSKQGVFGPAFAMLMRTALAVGAFRIARAISSGRLQAPRALAVAYLIAVLLITWIGIASSASPGSTVGFLSIESWYGRDPNAFVPELRQRPPGLPYGDVMIFPLALVFIWSVITVAVSRRAS